MHRADHFGTGRVDPSRRTADHHHAGFLEKRVETLTVHAGMRTNRDAVNGDHPAAHVMLNRLVRKHFGFVFAGEVELVDVHVHHLVLLFGRAKQNVESFGSASKVTFVSLGQATDDVHHFGADVKPFARFRINHSFECLIGKFHSDLIGIVLAGAKACLDGTIFGLRIDVHERGAGRAALLDHQFKEHGKAPVEVFLGRLAL